MQETRYVGLTIPDLLFVMLVGLKLATIITWSWWIVFAPLYVPPIITYILKAYTRWRVLAFLKKQKAAEDNVES